MLYRTHRSSRDARSLSSDRRRLLDIFETFCSAGCPHHGLPCAVCQLDVSAGREHSELLGRKLPGSFTVRTNQQS